MAELAALLGAIGTLLALLIPALRRRKDLDVEEMKLRLTYLETENDSLRAENEAYEKERYILRQLLNRNGIELP